jgi:hypothetical protein
MACNWSNKYKSVESFFASEAMLTMGGSVEQVILPQPLLDASQHSCSEILLKVGNL